MLNSHPQFDYVIWLDQDAMISNPEQQLVCLLEHWGVPPAAAANNSTARLWIANDTDAYHNHMTDATGQRVLNWNTGFMVWRNTDRSRQVLARWWSEALAHTEYHHFPFYDQSSFNGFVRPLLQSHEVSTIPCDEANGFGWLQEDSHTVAQAAFNAYKRVVNHLRANRPPQFNCQGRYITHAWRVKAAVGGIMQQRLAKAILEESSSWPQPLVLRADMSLGAEQQAMPQHSLR
ncbi:hypothetical protein OEZ85_012661 [Tetradesmus obliquus]|uniref:Glycosyltransferase 2-like domain-containing protein n=1 Tax=Tetradesmus obliquus TaxID=3088 RepID=A0ABY8U3U0_TETOB|nr:hypothetical protein OEZ85_012661 [Tetradesmus obliquus]